MGQKYTNISDLYKQVKLNEREIIERKLTSQELEDRERIAKKLPMADFKKRYGKDAMAVKMAVATNIAKGKSEETELDEGCSIDGDETPKVRMTMKEFALRNVWGEIDEAAEYDGRPVKLNNPTRGDVKKYKVYVRND